MRSWYIRIPHFIDKWRRSWDDAMVRFQEVLFLTLYFFPNSLNPILSNLPSTSTHILGNSAQDDIPPKFSGQLLSPISSISSHTSAHTLELYLDYVFLVSAKQFRTFYSSVWPLNKQKYTSPGIRVIFRQQIQPWHPSSTLVHEAGAVVLRTSPSKFWEFSEKLFERQIEYFDVNAVHEASSETYKRLGKLARSVEGIDESKILKLLTVGDKPGKDAALNVGNEVTHDAKLMVKANRLTGVHVTPTVLWNGVVEGSISSSWTKEH